MTKPLPEILKNYSESTQTKQIDGLTHIRHTLTDDRGELTLIAPGDFDWDRIQLGSLHLLGGRNHPIIATLRVDENPAGDRPIVSISQAILRGKASITFDHTKTLDMVMLVVDDSTVQHPITHPNLPVSAVEIINSAVSSLLLASTQGGNKLIIRQSRLKNVVLLSNQEPDTTTLVSNSIIRGVREQPILMANSSQDRRVIFDEKKLEDLDHENHCAYCQSYGDYLILTNQAVSAQGNLRIGGQPVYHYFQQLIDQQGIFHYYAISAPDISGLPYPNNNHLDYDTVSDTPNYDYFIREVTEVGPEDSRKLSEVFDEMIRTNELVDSNLIAFIDATMGHRIEDLIDQGFFN